MHGFFASSRPCVSPSCRSLPLAVLFFVLSVSAFGWGDDSHKAISRGAVPALPEEMRPFFLVNSEYIANHSLDPDYIPNRTQAQRSEHFLDIDEYGQPPFAELPHDLGEAKKKFGEETVVKRGLLPWTIQREFDRLVEAMKKKDWAETRLAAAHLSHFAADSTMPLHATVNYDGQLTKQKGIHFRFEVELVLRYHAAQMLLAAAPVAVESPTEWAFDQVKRSHALVAPVLIAEQKARDAAPLDSEAYYAEFERLAGKILDTRVRDAAAGVAGLWKAAWEKAGKPHMPPTGCVILIILEKPGSKTITARGAEAIAAEIAAHKLSADDAFAVCDANAPKHLQRLSLPFVLAQDVYAHPDAKDAIVYWSADDEPFITKAGDAPAAAPQHPYAKAAVTHTGDLKDTLALAERAVQQLPRASPRVIILSNGWKPDPLVLEAAKRLAAKKITLTISAFGNAEDTAQAAQLAAEAGATVFRSPDLPGALKALGPGVLLTPDWSEYIKMQQ